MDVRGNKLNEYQLGVTLDSIRRDGRRDAKAIPRRRDNSPAAGQLAGWSGEGAGGGIKCTFLIWTESGENVHELQIRDSSVGRSFGAFLRGDRRCRRVTLIINKYSYPLGSRT